MTIWSNKRKKIVVREKNLWEATRAIPKLEKTKKLDIIQSNVINLIKFNEIWLKSIKNHINVRTFDKKDLKTTWA